MAELFTIIPEYVFVLEPNWRTQQTPFEFGYVQTRAIWPRPKRVFILRWQSATLLEKEFIESFFHDHVGAAGAFDYKPPDPVATPYRPPTASQVSGGALSSRTYHYGITYTTVAGETAYSEQKSITVLANNLFRIAYPKFPANVTSVKLYVGSTAGAGNAHIEDTNTTSGATFTEPSGGFPLSGAAPPTTNTAIETVSVHLMEDRISLEKVTAGLYNIELKFEEIL